MTRLTLTLSALALFAGLLLAAPAWACPGNANCKCGMGETAKADPKADAKKDCAAAKDGKAKCEEHAAAAGDCKCKSGGDCKCGKDCKCAADGSCGADCGCKKGEEAVKADPKKVEAKKVEAKK